MVLIITPMNKDTLEMLRKIFMKNLNLGSFPE